MTPIRSRWEAATCPAAGCPGDLLRGGVGVGRGLVFRKMLGFRPGLKSRPGLGFISGLVFRHGSGFRPGLIGVFGAPPSGPPESR